MIWHDNLCLNKESKIPYNETSFFVFEAFWEDSIIIKFNINEMKYVDNLYISIQSLLWNKKIIATRIYTGIEKKELKRIFSYNNVFIIKKMNYIYFCDWWENILNHDKFYTEKEEENFYGIIICFSKSSLKNNNINKKNINELRPLYPWKEEIINHINYFKN